MTKLEIARELAERKDMPLADAIKAVDCVIDIMKDAFKNGRNVYLRGLGSFAINYQGAQGENRTQSTNWRSYHHTCPQGGKVQSITITHR